MLSRTLAWKGRAGHPCEGGWVAAVKKKCHELNIPEEMPQSCASIFQSLTQYLQRYVQQNELDDWANSVVGLLRDLGTVLETIRLAVNLESMQQQLDIVEEGQWGQQQQIAAVQADVERLQKAEEARLAAEEAARVAAEAKAAKEAARAAAEAKVAEKKAAEEEARLAAEAKAAEKAAQPASSRSALGDVTNEQQSANMEAHLAAKAKAAEEAAKEKARLAAEAKAAEEKAAEEAARAAAEAKAAEKKAAEEEEARLAVEAKAAEKTAQQAQLAQQAQPAVVGPRHRHRLLRLFRLLRPAQYCVILLLFSIYLVCASSHSSRERITTESFFQVASPIFLQSHPIPSHLILSRLITSNPTPPDPTRSHATPCNPVRSRAISSYSNSSPPYLIPFHPTPSCPV